MPTYAVSNTFTYLILTQKPTPAMHQYSHYIHLSLLFNHLGGFPPKAASAEAMGKVIITAAAYNKQREKVVLVQGSILQSCIAGLLHRAPGVCAGKFCGLKKIQLFCIWIIFCRFFESIETTKLLRLGEI